MPRMSLSVSEERIVDRVSKRVTSYLKKQSSGALNVNQYAVPFGYNSMNADNNRRIGGTDVTFKTLRQLSINHETVRAAINVRKRQITQLDWDLTDMYPDSGSKYSDQQRIDIKKTLLNIGGPGVRFREILDKLIEDTLVLDALCLYRQKTVGGELLRIIPIDGATIKIKVDESGLVPQAPEIGFEQWTNGKKVAELTTDELLYSKMNPRSNSPYGLSPIESIIITVDASLRAALYNSNYLSDNNIPQGFINVPEGWTVNQIKEYKEAFDAMVSAPKDQAKIFPIPSGAKYIPTSKPSDFAFKDFFDYLDRKIAMIFEVTPQELGLTLQQYKENAEGQERIQMRKGVKPLAHFLEEIFTHILQNDLGYEELAFRFSGLETRYQTDQIPNLVQNGVVSIDEIRNDMGLPLIGVDNLIMFGGNIIPAKTAEATFEQNQKIKEEASKNETENNNQKDSVPDENQSKEQNPEAEKADLKAWENKALHDMKAKGKVYRKFDSDFIQTETKTSIETQLEKAKNTQDVKKIFKELNKSEEGKTLMKFEENKALNKALSSSKSKDFKKSIIVAFEKQIEPFTKESTIEKITTLKKDDISDYENGVDDYLPKIIIQGLQDFLKWGATQGGQNAYSSLHIEGAFTMRNDMFTKLFSDRENYLIKSVDETTKEWLVRQIVRGKDAGFTNQQIATMIADGSNEMTLYRAEMIVNTETANSMQTAELQTYKDQGVEKKRWVTSEDDRVDSICSELEGEEVSVEEAFHTGDDAPPAHPNCRCFIQAVVEPV